MRYPKLLLFLLISICTNAQEKVVITPSMAVQMALEKNPDLINNDLRVSYAEAQKRAAADIGRFDMTYRSGSLYSDENSKYLEVTHDFGSLPGIIYGRRLADKELTLASAGRDMKKKELVMAVKSAYYYWIYQNNRVKLLSDKQKVFSGLNAFAEMKYDSGLISPEEKTGIESAASEAAMQLASAIADMEISANKLRMYMMSNDDLEPSLQNLPLYQVERASDTMTYSGRTLINFYRAVLDASSESVRLKKSSFFPDVSAGIINQKIGSSKGLWAWQVGISLPLPPVSEAAEVEQARIDEKIASNDLENRIFVTEKEIENLLIELEKTFGSIMYFDRYSLVQAEQAEENAKAGLDRGEISYYDYAKKIAESNEIKLIYLETVDRYNQLAIQLEFYMD